jgi:hypothetical protein
LKWEPDGASAAGRKKEKVILWVIDY